ncbi:MAG: hypothetical protein KIT73_12730, partial [Burkholderiales bacterium]|nr:hypothetical protein [Burkholderiales bacterium]
STDDDFIVTVDWGDGTGEQPADFDLAVYRGGDDQEGGYGGQAPGSYGTLKGSHAYADDGTYTVAVRVSDGSASSLFEFDIVVANVAPVIADGFELPAPVEGSAFELEIPFVDAGTLDVHTATIDFGDGTVVTAEVTEETFGPPGSAAGMGGFIRAAHAYVDDGVYRIVVALQDDNGGSVEHAFELTVADVAPTLDSSGATTTGTEGSEFVFEAVLTDPGVDDRFDVSVNWGDGSETSAAEVVLRDGAWHVLARHAYADDGEYVITTVVHDADSGAALTESELVVDIDDVPGVVTLGGTTSVLEGAPYLLHLDVTDPGDDTIDYWIVDWGDGVVRTFDGATQTLQHIYDVGETTRTIVATAFDEDAGTSVEGRIAVDVKADYLKVDDFTATETGFAVRFTRPFVGSQVNLYGGLGTVDPLAGPTDVIVTQDGRPVRGSIFVDADKQGFRFVRTGGPLAAGTYAVTLSARHDGFVDTLGRVLDGNGDGTNADAFTTTFTVMPSPARTLSIADFMRGPGQTVDLTPANANDGTLPIVLSDGAGVASVSFALGYDPALLLIGAITAAPGLPEGSSIDVVREESRILVTVTVNGVLPAGAVALVQLQASVPADAPYGAAQILDLTEVTVRDGQQQALAVRSDDGVHLVGYLGDTSGNGAYSTLDIQRMQRVLGGMDAGFGAYPRIDPNLVADVNGVGGFTSVDLLRLTQHVQGLSNPQDNLQPRPEIPPLPENAEPLQFVGPDPVVSVTANPSGRPGSVVTVPVSLDTAAGLESVQLRIAYDPAVLEYVELRRGDLTADFNWFVSSHVPGLVTVDATRLQPLARGTGALLQIDFRIREGASAGDTAIDIQAAALNETRLTLNPLPVPGLDATDGRVTVETAKIDWSGRFGDFRMPRKEAPPPAPAATDDWTRTPWAKDLSDRLVTQDRDDNGEKPATSRVATPGREILRSLSKAFTRR